MKDEYFRLTEVNAWEREKWNFFFPLENNFEAMIWLIRIGNLADKKFYEIESNTKAVGGSPFMRPIKLFAASRYIVDYKLYSEQEAEDIISKSSSTYMNGEFFKEARLNAKALQKKVLWVYDKLEQCPLYKGGIINFVDKRKNKSKRWFNEQQKEK